LGFPGGAYSEKIRIFGSFVVLHHSSSPACLLFIGFLFVWVLKNQCANSFVVCDLGTIRD